MYTDTEFPDLDTPEDQPMRVDPLARACGIVTLLGVTAFAVICIGVQFVRTDLDWITAPMSIYTLGPWGAFVRGSFFAPAPGLALLGVGWYRSIHVPVRKAAALALFITAGVALCFTGAFLTDTTPTPTTLHGEIHQWATFGCFVCLTTAMILQSWWLHIDPHWRKHFVSAFTLAVVAVVYFWVYALFKPIARGIGEKMVIGLVMLWVWRAAWWLVRGRSP